eukprot:5047602-Karenia_brevis.AAC.1
MDLKLMMVMMMVDMMIGPNGLNRPEGPHGPNGPKGSVARWAQRAFLNMHLHIVLEQAFTKNVRT